MRYEAQSEEIAFSPEQEAELRQIAVDRARSTLDQFDAELSDDEVFVDLPNVTAAAFHLGQFSEAESFAKEALRLAPKYRKNWNYGNAIHKAHTVLGLLAITRGDLTKALEELKLAGGTPGSPQLNSFGPTMHLAKELLKRGHREAVLSYLEQCRKFWEMGTTWLDLWEQMILAGRIPNCFQHSYV